MLSEDTEFKLLRNERKNMVVVLAKLLFVNGFLFAEIVYRVGFVAVFGLKCGKNNL